MVNSSHSRRAAAAFRYSFIAALLLLLAAGSAAAQSSVPTSTTPPAMPPQGMGPGSPAGSYALSGFDNVNLLNGNLNFRLPLLTIGGRGTAGYTMTLATNTKTWQGKTQLAHHGGGGGTPVCIQYPSTEQSDPTRGDVRHHNRDAYKF